MNFRDSSEKLPLALIFSWHFDTSPSQLTFLFIHSFFCRLFFILVPSIHITTFIAYVTSALLPWFPPFLSGHSYTVSTSSWLLLDTCEYLLIPCLPLNYSFSGFILGGQFYVTSTLQRTFKSLFPTLPPLPSWRMKSLTTFKYFSWKFY